MADTVTRSGGKPNTGGNHSTEKWSVDSKATFGDLAVITLKLWLSIFDTLDRQYQAHRDRNIGRVSAGGCRVELRGDVAPRWPRPPISGQMLHQGPHVGERCSFENIPNNRGGDGATLAAGNDRP
jgi:hypothetical protein